MPASLGAGAHTRSEVTLAAVSASAPEPGQVGDPLAGANHGWFAGTITTLPIFLPSCRRRWACAACANGKLESMCGLICPLAIHQQQLIHRGRQKRIVPK